MDLTGRQVLNGDGMSTSVISWVILSFAVEKTMVDNLAGTEGCARFEMVVSVWWSTVTPEAVGQ